MASEKVNYIISLQDKFSPGLKQAQSNLSGFESKVTKLNNPLKGLIGTLGGVGLALGAFAVGKEILQLGADMETTRVTFSTFLGDIGKANVLIQQLQTFASKTPFEFQDLKKSATLLLNFGVSANQILPTLKTLGDLSAGSAEKLDSITSAYGKILSKGKADLESLNVLVEGGQIPIMKQLEKQYGVTGAELSKMITNGKVGAGDIQKAFVGMTSKGGMFFNMMDKQSQTLQGRWSTLVDNLKNNGIKIGESLIEPFGKIVDAGSDAIQWLQDNWSNLKRIFAPLKEAFQPIINILNDLQKRWQSFNSDGKGTEKIFNAIGAVMSWLAPVFKALGDIIFTVYEAVMKIIFAMIDFADRNKIVIRWLLSLWTVARNVFVGIANMVKEIFGGVGDIIAGAYNGSFEQVAKGTANVVKAIANNNAFTIGKEVVDGFKEGFAYDGKIKDFFGAKKGAGAKDETIEQMATDAGGGKGGGSGTGGKLGSDIGSISNERAHGGNVSITIEKLIDKFEITTNNMTESKQQIYKLVVEALGTAINDSQRLRPA